MAESELDHQPDLAFTPTRLLWRFWRLASRFWLDRRAWPAWILTIFLIGIVVSQLLVQYLLNLWNRHFFDALGRHDARTLWSLAELFVPLAIASVALAGISVWGRMTTQRRWRESLTRQVIEYWLDRDHLHRLNDYESGSENPEYRISEDVRIATDAPVDLSLALLSSILTSIIFLSVLWIVGGSLNVEALGRTRTIPGYLVISVILYSGFFSGKMILLGRHLTEVVEHKNQAEAEFRATADLLRQNEGGATQHGNMNRKALWMAVHAVLLRWQDLGFELARTTLVSQGNTLLAPIVAWILCVPKYLSGAMSLGELTQAAAAFVTVQAAFNWLVDNYQRLADWRSSVNRVATLLFAIDALDRVEVAHDRKKD